MPRPRSNQPGSYGTHPAAGVISGLMGRYHDYYYYPSSWTDNSGKYYEAGYYDENGQYYKNVAVENKETILTCEYCGSTTKLIWKEGLLPSCGNCGAPLKLDVTDKLRSGENEEIYPTDSDESGTGKRWLTIIIVVAAVLFAAQTVISIIGACFSDSSDEYSGRDGTANEITSDLPSEALYYDGEGIYADPIGRFCEFDGENFYDPETECWFYYDEDATLWKYWYEGISSEYGDYGWMEYDNEDSSWYIETSDGNWQKLDASADDTGRLWHFDYLYVEEIGRNITLYGDEYYDAPTDCWLYHYEDEDFWQYWYGDISSDYGDYGWMEYDYDESQWYINVNETEWEILDTDYYDTSRLWHFNKK